MSNHIIKFLGLSAISGTLSAIIETNFYEYDNTCDTIKYMSAGFISGIAIGILTPIIIPSMLINIIKKKMKVI